MKSDIQNLQQRITSLELHIENSTDRNIQLLAENFIEASIADIRQTAESSSPDHIVAKQEKGPLSV